MSYTAMDPIALAALFQAQGGVKAAEIQAAGRGIEATVERIRGRTQRDVADTQAQAQRFGSRKQLEGQKYGADKSSAAQIYGADKSSEAQKFGAKKQLEAALAQVEATRYGAEQSRAASEYGALTGAEASKESAKEAAKASKYGADQSLEGAKQSALASKYGAQQSRAASEFGATTSAQASRDVAAENRAAAMDQILAQLGIGDAFKPDPDDPNATAPRGLIAEKEFQAGKQARETLQKQLEGKLGQATGEGSGQYLGELGYAHKLSEMAADEKLKRLNKQQKKIASNLGNVFNQVPGFAQQLMGTGPQPLNAEAGAAQLAVGANNYLNLAGQAQPQQAAMSLLGGANPYAFGGQVAPMVGGTMGGANNLLNLQNTYAVQNQLQPGANTALAANRLAAGQAVGDTATAAAANALAAQQPFAATAGQLAGAVPAAYGQSLAGLANIG